MKATDYQCEFRPSARDETLRALAVRYHERCESYDLTVCTGVRGRDGIMPASTHEQKLINRNAREVLDHVRAEANLLGYTNAELYRAIGKYSNVPITVDNGQSND